MFAALTPRSSLLALSLTVAPACGPTSPPVAPAPANADDKYEAGDDEEISAEEEALLAQIDAEADAADDEAFGSDEEGEETEGAEKEKREVVYRVSPDGLKVEVLGAQFEPRAKAVRVGQGWGVELTVQASTDEALVLYSPKTGPLAFGGKVTGSQAEKFGDRREGGAEVNLTPGKLVSFSRKWPEDGKPGLKPGEELELHVGLWGLGNSTENRRPVNRFLVVRMKANGKSPKPLIQPPNQ